MSSAICLTFVSFLHTIYLPRIAVSPTAAATLFVVPGLMPFRHVTFRISACRGDLAAPALTHCAPTARFGPSIIAAPNLEPLRSRKQRKDFRDSSSELFTNATQLPGHDAAASVQQADISRCKKRTRRVSNCAAGQH